MAEECQGWKIFLGPVMVIPADFLMEEVLTVVVEKLHPQMQQIL